MTVKPSPVIKERARGAVWFFFSSSLLPSSLHFILKVSHHCCLLFSDAIKFERNKMLVKRRSREELTRTMAQVASTQSRWGGTPIARPFSLLASSVHILLVVWKEKKKRKKPVAPADGVDDSVLWLNYTCLFSFFKERIEVHCGFAGLQLGCNHRVSREWIHDAKNRDYWMTFDILVKKNKKGIG